MPPLRTALLQSSGVLGDTAENLKALDEAAARAAQSGAGLLVTSEMFLTGYALDLQDIPGLAEPADGAIAQAIGEIARRHGIAVLYGYPEGADGVVYNAAQLIGPDGAALANYRKTHLFGCFEQDAFTPATPPSSRRT